MSGSADIRSVIRRSDATVLLRVELSNGEDRETVEFVLLDELFLQLDIKEGITDSETLSLLDMYAQVTAAYMSACASFAYVPSSLRALYLKLVRKGFSKEPSAHAIEMIRSHGFVDEDRIAHRRAELMLKKYWGRSKILLKLREEGFPDSVISDVSDMLCEVDFAENCARVIEKKFFVIPEDRKEKDRMYSSLKRLGYSAADIKNALRMLSKSE